jgi:hypothetical protein
MTGPEVFRTKTFTRWMRGSGLTDQALSEAVGEMAAGLIDADLGGHLAALQEIAGKFLSMSSLELESLISMGELMRVNHDDSA